MKRIGEIIEVVFFGDIIQEKIVDYSESHNLYQCAIIGANGSCWRSEEEIVDMKRRVKEIKNHNKTK